MFTKIQITLIFLTFIINQKSFAKIQDKKCSSRDHLENPLLIEKKPTFDCNRALTVVEKTICDPNNEMRYKFANLDHVLSTVYKRGLILTNHPQEFKKQQLKWLKERHQKSKYEDSLDLPSLLSLHYENRIRQLLKDNKVLDSILVDIFNKKSTNPQLVSYALLELLASQRGGTPGDIYDLAEDLVNTKYFKVSNDKLFILFTSGSHPYSYSSYEITRARNSFKADHWQLPSINNQTTNIFGNILYIDTEKQYFSASILSDANTNEQYEWHFENDNFVLYKCLGVIGDESK